MSAVHVTGPTGGRGHHQYYPRRDGQAELAYVAGLNTIKYQTIQWETELKYLGIHIVRSMGFKCSLTAAKRSFYRAANAVIFDIQALWRSGLSARAPECQKLKLMR